MYYGSEQRWADEAESLKPVLHHYVVEAKAIVRPEESPAAWQGWQVRETGKVEDFYGKALENYTEVILDFGEYCVGTPVLQFSFERRNDSPMRIEFKLAETPYELAYDFQQYRTSGGWLSRAWLQDGVVVCDENTAEVRFPRRYAFRYMALRIYLSAHSVPKLLSAACDCTTSADWSMLQNPAEKGDTLDQQIRKIGLVTLAACMQDFYEDGPKRDRRLWLGDLRLQMMADAQAFRNFQLAKRCLLLFAATASPAEGRISGSLYPAKPLPLADNDLFDYTVLFGDILLSYVETSGDTALGLDLLPVAIQQSRLALQEIENDCFRDFNRHWLFIDWKEGLQKECAEHGVVIYSLIRTLALAKKLGQEALVTDFPEIIERLQKAGVRKWYDREKGFFADNGQISWAAQIWAAYAEMLPPEEIRRILTSVMAEPSAVRPGGPYLHNQMALVLEKYGLHAEARELIRGYWGKMAEQGADTFWEIFDPAQPFLSPYGEAVINSHCHAWSTPVIL